MAIFQKGSKHHTKHPPTNYQLLVLINQPIRPVLGFKKKQTNKDVDKIRTAVTLGWSIQGSTIKGPTLFTMTIVLLFCAATASMRSSPPCHAVRLLLKNKMINNKYSFTIFVPKRLPTDHLHFQQPHHLLHYPRSQILVPLISWQLNFQLVVS